MSRADPMPTATVSARVATGSNDPIQPLLVKNSPTYRIAPFLASFPMPALVAAPAPQPEPQRTVAASADTVPPVAVHGVNSDPVKPEAALPDITKTEPTKGRSPKTRSRQPTARTGPELRQVTNKVQTAGPRPWRMAHPDRRLSRRTRSQAAIERGTEQSARQARSRQSVHRARAQRR